MNTSLIKGLPNKELLRPDEVAEYFGVTKAVIYKWIRMKELKGIRLGKKTLRIKYKEVIKFKKKCDN